MQVHMESVPAETEIYVFREFENLSIKKKKKNPYLLLHIFK